MIFELYNDPKGYGNLSEFNCVMCVRIDLWRMEYSNSFSIYSNIDFTKRVSNMADIANCFE